MSESTIRDNKSYSNNINSFNVWNYTIADDRSQLLSWLSPIEPKLRHRDIQERRVDSVGEWLMKTDEFRSWYDGSGEGKDDKAVLFCYGGPGVGKTFISSLVVDWLCDRVRGQNTAVTCFYLDFAARKEQSVTNILGSLLKQVVGGMEKVPEEISRAFEEQKMAIGGRGLRLPDIVKMLQSITSSLRTFVCIDALDECAAVHRVKLLDSLKQILEKSPRTRIFIIGRPHIRAAIEKRLAGRVVSVPISPSKDDITGYLRARMDEDDTPEAMDESLVADILQKIPENLSEMFLLVSLNIEAILHESTIHRRRERLSKMTKGLELENVYGATIERIKAQDGDKPRLGMAALMWVSHAERPLQADELCYALAVELGSTNFNSGNVPPVSTLISCCQGLITVDKEASTVRLIHFTLQEYLSAHPNILRRLHSAMAEICLTYLCSEQVRAISAESSPDILNTPFVKYCSLYWGVHAKRELSDCARSLALKFLLGCDGHISSKFLLWRAIYGDYISIESPAKGYESLVRGHLRDTSSFSGIHCASFFGIFELVAALINMECYDINEGSCQSLTPLAWAALNGQEGVVEALLGWEEVNPEKPGIDGRTPLSHAASRGHEAVVKILLGREEVNPDKPDNFGRTPLSFAAQNGCEAVVKILLERGEVNPDRPDNFGRTPLLYTASNGQEVVVKILLGRDEVNPDRPDRHGRTPLSFATQNGHEGVLKTLLGCEEVNPDKPDKYGQTPLSFAASKGHETVVTILLSRGEVNPDLPDYHGQTPLLLASERGHNSVVALLQPRPAVTYSDV